MEKVSIKNISGHRVGISVPELRLNRTIDPNKSISLDKEKFEEAITYPGVPELFERKYLLLNEVQEAIEVGLASDSDVTYENGEATYNDAATKADIERILTSGTDFQLKKILADCNDYRKTEIANIASHLDNITLSKIDIIKTMTGVDLTKIIRE